ncbi:hypothetical protein C1645_731187 [Glomus cerebriforme]|uniref:Cyclin N-terminal domain-containing protein n=1 Tax=Glomus cerebriforme TaxID=658196 RepID=A0A397TR92_9GLOM|nr:hypothetical protein C1645_731187 [Glomus cerebriforme]
MTTTSPRRIPRRRDSSRQAAFTFLSNISLGTESYPPNNLRATAVPSHAVPSPSQSSDAPLKSDSLEKQQQSNNNDQEVLGNGKPSLQTNTKKTTSIPPKKKRGNNVLSKSRKTIDNDIIYETPIETYDEEHNLNNRRRSNSLREEATNFLTNISLDPKKSKPCHPSREGKVVLEVDDGSIIEVDMNQIDTINGLEFNKNCRRGSESTYKSDSSSSADSITLNEKSASHKPQRRHPSPNSNQIHQNNSNDQISSKQNNANSSSSMGFLSMLGYDKKSKQKNRQDQMKQTADLETIKRRKAESFAHLLVPSNSLGPEENNRSYNPTYLDNPNLKTEKQLEHEVQEVKPSKHRTVLSLSSIMGSFMHHNNRPSDLKRESNARFRNLHNQEVDPTLTLSQIRKVKLKLLTAATHEDLDLELSTVAKAYVYFEKLILKKVVNKANRRLYGSICLLLASKVNEPMGISYSPLLESLHKHLDVTIKDITDNEFSVFAHLDFELYLPTQEFMPHFEQLVRTLDYNKEEYLGSNPFYEFNLIG